MSFFSENFCKFVKALELAETDCRRNEPRSYEKFCSLLVPLSCVVPGELVEFVVVCGEKVVGNSEVLLCDLEQVWVVSNELAALDEALVGVHHHLLVSEGVIADQEGEYRLELGLEGIDVLAVGFLVSGVDEGHALEQVLFDGVDSFLPLVDVGGSGG